MTEPLRIHAHALVSTPDLLQLAINALDAGLEHHVPGPLLADLDPHEEVRHVLTMHACLDRVAGNAVAPFLRCMLHAKVAGNDEPIEVQHVDVRLRDYAALDVPSYDEGATHELVRQFDLDAIVPDSSTPDHRHGES